MFIFADQEITVPDYKRKRMNFMKKTTAILLGIMFIIFCSGCGAEMEKMQSSLSDEQPQSTENRHTENYYTEDANDIEEKSKAVNDIEEKSEIESIQDEIAKVEVKSCEYENADWGSMGQQEMNQLTAQW